MMRGVSRWNRYGRSATQRLGESDLERLMHALMEVYAVVVCLSVCVGLSVTCRCATKMAEPRTTITRSHDSPGNLIF